MKYSWSGISDRFLEQIAQGRLVGEARALITDLAGKPYQAVNDAALAELLAATNATNTGVLYFLPEAYGALADGVTDDTVAWNAAITAASNAGGGIVLGRAGKTYAVANLALLSFVTLDLRGVTLKMKASAAGGDTCIKITGNAINAPVALTANVAAGATTIAVADTTGVLPGALVNIFDNTYKDAIGHVGRNQEIARVLSVVTNTSITFTTGLYGSYTTAASASYQWFTKAESPRVYGGTLLIPPGVNGGGIYGDMTYDVVCRDVDVVGPNSMAAFRFDRSYAPKIFGGSARDGQNQGSGGGFGYGALFYESTIGGLCFGYTSRNLRENPCVSANARHCTFSHCTDWGSTWSFSTHSTGSEHTLFQNCKSMYARNDGFALNDGNNTAPDTWITCDNCDSIGSGFQGFLVAGSNGASYNASHVHFNNCRVDGFGLTTATAGIEVDYATDVLIEGSTEVCAPGVALNNQGIWLVGVTDASVIGAYCHDILNGYGIQIQSTLGKVLVADCKIRNCLSYNVRSVTANNDLEVRGCRADDALVNKLAGDKFHDNDWGGKFDDQIGSTAAVTDGSTIAHSLVAAPTQVLLQTSVAGEFASVTALGATTFTVAIKKHDGTAGTSQTIHWRAAVRP